VSSAAVFISFLSSYQIFLSAIAGILICDYYVLRRGFLDIPALYTHPNESHYGYFHGFNLRAFAVYFIAIAPNFYGFLNQMGVGAPLGIQRFYYFAYPVGITLAFGAYYLLNVLWPAADALPTGWQEPKDYVSTDDMRLFDVVDSLSAESGYGHQVGEPESKAPTIISEKKA
jgi:NCS1 family nucleobase:cation symporter-1